MIQAVAVITAVQLWLTNWLTVSLKQFKPQIYGKIRCANYYETQAR